MYTFFVILIVIAALLMIGIVLIQESKGGGLSSNFSSSNQIMGVRKTTDFIEGHMGACCSYGCAQRGLRPCRSNCQHLTECP